MHQNLKLEKYRKKNPKALFKIKRESKILPNQNKKYLKKNKMK